MLGTSLTTVVGSARFYAARLSTKWFYLDDVFSLTFTLPKLVNTPVRALSSSGGLRVADQMMSNSDKSTFNFEATYFKKGLTNSLVGAEDFFKRYDKKGKGYLDKDDFSCLLNVLFSHEGKPHPISESQKQALYQRLKDKESSNISLPSFRAHWKNFFRPILDPVNAFLVIDVQNDFVTGSLAMSKGPAKQNAEEIIPIINELLNDVPFDHVIYTRDWHPKDHISFYDNRMKWPTTSDSPVLAKDAKMFDTLLFEGHPPVTQVLWPAHCVQDTEGAQFPNDLKIKENAPIINKGMASDTDYYSAFKDSTNTRPTSFASDLSKLDITTLYVCGLAYDFCVGETCIDSVEAGFKTIVIEDAVRGSNDELIAKMKDNLKKLSVAFVNSSEVADLVHGKDRRPEVALQAKF